MQELLARHDKNPGKDHVRWSYQILLLLACKTLARLDKNTGKIHPKMVSPNLATTGLQELAKICMVNILASLMQEELLARLDKNPGKIHLKMVLSNLAATG